MSFDVAAVRADFPSLTSGLAHFDGPGGTQTPRQVGDAIAAALTGPLSNRGTTSLSELNAEHIVASFRGAMADFLGADPAGIVYGRSATQLTYDFARHLGRDWGSGDEIVVSRLDHDSNIRPWLQAAERAGATVRWVEFDAATGELSAADVAAQLSPQTRLVAITAASNLIGTMPPIAEIAGLVHAEGALLYVDGVHYAAHEFVDVAELGADFFVCSPYKFLGPHCGVLAASPALLETITPDKLLPSTNNVPERFEFGTLPYEMMAGVTAAVDYLAGMAPDAAAQSRRERLRSSLHNVGEHEDLLRERIEAGVDALPGVTRWSRATHRTSTILLSIEGHDCADLYRALAGRGVIAPASNFYAVEASHHLGLGDAGGLRVGLAPYSTEEDVDRLVEGLRILLKPSHTEHDPLTESPAS